MVMRTIHSLGVLTIPITLGLISVNLVGAEDYPAPTPLVSTVVDDPVAELQPVPETGPVAEGQLPTPEVAADAAPAPAPMPCRCCNSVCCTKKKKDAATEKMKGAYKGVFYANDFSYLDDPCYGGDPMCGDAFKGLMGGKMDMGGEVRVRYHNEEGHRGLGLTGRDDNFWLTRLRLFNNYRVNDIFRIYGEYLYADSGGEFFNNRPIEENRGELQNLFLDTNLLSGDGGGLKLRVGRQELLLGAQRLVSPLDWANTRRTFDGGRLMYQGDNWDIDGFFVHPMNRNAANENKIDDANENIDFFGMYGSRKGLDIGTLEAYYLGLDNSDSNFDYHTLGTRVVGSTDKFLYEMEGGVQFGSNSDGSDHDAGFFTGGLGKKLRFCTCNGEWNPIVWMWYDWASGGDSTFVNRGDNSFDHAFPLAHKYNGFMDLFGRRNLHDINFQFITPVMGSKKVKLLVWYHHFFLDKATTPYGVTMQPYNTTALAGDKELGSEIDLALNVTLTPRDSMLIGYSHFNSGDYYQTTPGVLDSGDAQFFYAQFQKRF